MVRAMVWRGIVLHVLSSHSLSRLKMYNLPEQADFAVVETKGGEKSPKKEGGIV
jgi:hypothetical protein